MSAATSIPLDTIDALAAIEPGMFAWANRLMQTLGEPVYP
jgi:hypothetical protein